VTRQRIRLSRPRVRITPTPSTPTLLDCINDPHLFAPWFRDPSAWQAWFAFIAALFALPMTADQLAIYREHTGRDEPPAAIAKEGWLICGRRAGKSFVLAVIAVYLACFQEYRQYLAPGERATIFVIATDRKQARIILRYVRALLSNVPMLARMVEREWAEDQGPFSFSIDTGGFGPSAVSLVAWLNGDTLKKRLIEHIERTAKKDALQLTAEERSVRLSDLTSQLRALGHEEEALIIKARDEGTEIIRRSDVDAQCVLGIRRAAEKVAA
jgi:hypothetical protein